MKYKITSKLSNNHSFYVIPLAMIHVGLGEQQVNGILAELNIPSVSHSMLDERQREIGGVIEHVAEESINEWMAKEVALNNE